MTGMTGDPEPLPPIIGIAALTDSANAAQISVSLDFDGHIRLCCRSLDGSGRECQAELSPDEAHALAHAIHDAVTWPCVSTGQDLE
jgi:hypothetical protein